MIDYRPRRRIFSGFMLVRGSLAEKNTTGCSGFPKEGSLSDAFGVDQLSVELDGIASKRASLDPGGASSLNTGSASS